MKATLLAPNVVRRYPVVSSPLDVDRSQVHSVMMTWHCNEIQTDDSLLKFASHPPHLKRERLLIVWLKTLTKTSMDLENWSNLSIWMRVDVLPGLWKRWRVNSLVMNTSLRWEVSKARPKSSLSTAPKLWILAGFMSSLCRRISKRNANKMRKQIKWT